MERIQGLENVTSHELASSPATPSEQISSNIDKQRIIQSSLPSPTYLLNKRTLNLITEDFLTPDPLPDSPDKMPSDSIAPEPVVWRSPKYAKKNVGDYISARGSADITDVFHTIADPLHAADVSLASPPVQKAPRSLYLPSLGKASIFDCMPVYSDFLVQSSGAGPSKIYRAPMKSSMISPLPLEGSIAKEQHAEVNPVTSSFSCKQVKRCISVFTPPDEETQISWEIPSDQKPSSVSISECKDEEENEHKILADRSVAMRSDAGAADSSSWINLLGIDGQWLSDALKILITHKGGSSSEYDTINVLSQALPFPSLSGYAFSSIRNIIEQNTEVKIRFCHAVPTAFSLSDIPTPPPGTPSSGAGGDDYFSPKTYDSAVAIRDYQGTSKGLLPTPNPVVPPSTVHVSILERYIPPTNCNEIISLFDSAGPCLLVDRLVELSPAGGKLLFIYPTRKGGKTFATKYLGPIIEPLLRSMTIVNGLFSDLASMLGRMQSVDNLYSYDGLRSKLESLCKRLTSQDRTPKGRYNGQPTSFSVVYAAPKTVKLERKIWSEKWWVRQEELRIRTAVKRYYNAAQRLADGSDATHARLIQSVLDGVVSRPYPNGIEPKEEIEVGLFVIARSN